MAGIDKRRQMRFPLQLPTYIRLINGKESESIEFTTENICSGGAFFHTNRPIPLGTKVEVDLVIPIDQLKTIVSDKVLIEVAGAVVRADEEGMAVCFDCKYSITPLKV